MTDRGLTLTTTVRVIAGVHDGTANGRTDTHMAFSSRFTEFYVLVVSVADYTDGRSAIESYHTNFAGRKSYLSVVTFLSHKLCAVAC